MRRTVTRGTPEYPSCLGRLSQAPARLRVAGCWPLDWARAVAIVGTRAADVEGSLFARVLARELAEAGCCIVSGGARGIDIAAHEGALEAEGQSVVVLAGGLEHASPRAHRPVFRALQRGGAVISEHEDGVVPQGFSFLRRNRIIAGLSCAVVVVQAPARSGALSTARHALLLDVPLFAVPAAPWDPRGAGVRALLKGGARVCDAANDVLAALAADAAHPHPVVARQRSPHTLATVPHQSPPSHALYRPEDERAARVLMAALGARPRHPDELVACTGLSLRDVQSTLLELELGGRVSLRPGGRYVVAPDCGE